MKADLPVLPGHERVGRRLVNSKFPPISLFDDVASGEEFEALYRLQALTNPRLQTEVGDLGLLRREEIPFGISGCSYATAPFTHVNPDGSRFSDGSFGMLYIADTSDTALAEVEYHQRRYWSGVQGLNYDRFVFRMLRVSFSDEGFADACSMTREDLVYSPDSYHAARQLGLALRQSESPGLQYWSVRHAEGVCWGLFTPSVVSDIVQTSHYEMVWSGGDISSISRLEILSGQPA